MASLNHAVLAPSNLSPLPLPLEKFVLAAPSISLWISPSISGIHFFPSAPVGFFATATGSVHVSNQRIISVSSAAGSLATGSVSVAEGRGSGRVVLQTLSVPHASLLDGKYVEPWFSAPSYSVLVTPEKNGGLEGQHFMRLSFKESGGKGFFELMQKTKDQLAVGGGSHAVNSEP